MAAEAGSVVRECGGGGHSCGGIRACAEIMMAQPAGPVAAPERTHRGERALRAGAGVRGTEGVREGHQGLQPGVGHWKGA